MGSAGVTPALLFWQPEAARERRRPRCTRSASRHAHQAVAKAAEEHAAAEAEECRFREAETLEVGTDDDQCTDAADGTDDAGQHIAPPGFRIGIGFGPRPPAGPFRAAPAHHCCK